MMLLRIACAVAVAAAATLAPLSAQVADARSTYHVFLKDGTSLPGFGEYALVEDRIVFNLFVGGTAAEPALQLMSLPTATIDLERTGRYRDAMRAAYYAATRGDADYAAMTSEVARALDQLANITDRKQRLELAEEARRRLLSWWRDHYYFKEQEVRELIGLFDEAIADLRAAAGESAFSLDLSTGPVVPPREPLREALTLREMIAAALAASAATDIGEDRIAILRAVSARTVIDGVPADLGEVVNRRLNDEIAAETAYAALATDLRARAERAQQRGDVVGAEALIVELGKRDRLLGSRRPQTVQSLAVELTGRLEATRNHRLALDHYAAVKVMLFQYERDVRPALSGMDGLTSVFAYIRDRRSVAIERIDLSLTRIARFQALLGRVVPPAIAEGVHATLASAIRMAHEACARRRMAVITNNVSYDREASSAAAGALLLLEQARRDLLAVILPPKAH